MSVGVIAAARDFRRACQEARRDGELALVPTMGYLHAGHQSLIQAAAQRAPAVAVTIFVNPTQFGAGDDLLRYPRDIDGDLRKCEQAGATFAFVPRGPEELYPAEFQTYVEPGPLAAPLCGEKRPGHFRGVCTVVAKLFNLLTPDAAVFGEKDYQQLAVIRRMVRDLNFPIEIIGVQTVREADGLALSSRNQYLNADERTQATVLYRAMTRVKELADGGQKSVRELIDAAKGVIASAKSARVDYVAIVDAVNLHSLETLRPNAVIALAVFIGKTRLIDNLRLT